MNIEMEKLSFFSKNKNNPSANNFKHLTEENERLQLQIDLMISKINSLYVKTEELRKIISELQNQKKLLIESIENLEELHKQKEELIAIASHDIKNPAGTIKNLVGLLETFDLTNQEQIEIHQSLINISNRIVTIVNEVSITVKRSKGTFDLNLSKNNLNVIVDLILKRYDGVATNKSIELTSKIDSSIPDILFDKNKIDEVIENLLNNALKFAPPKSSVKIITRKETEFVVFEVIDNGPGLTAEEAKMAFEKEVKLSNSPTGNENSTGLGLWIVRKFVEKHNGKVWIKSKKGVGSTFAFKIPIKQKED